MKYLLLLSLCLSAALDGFAQEKKQSAYLTSTSPTSLENIDDALKILNFNIYNINLPVDSQKTYLMKVYLEEYDKGMKLKKSDTVRYETIGKEAIRKVEPKLSLIIRDLNDTTITMLFKTPEGERISLVKKAAMYNIKHMGKIFKSQPLVPGKKIPLLLYGSMWHDPSLPKDAVRFCMERQLAPDFSSEAFTSMPHYYLIFVEITEKLK